MNRSISSFSEGDKSLVFYNVILSTDNLRGEDYKKVKENPETAQISQGTIDSFLALFEEGKHLPVWQIHFYSKAGFETNGKFADPLFKQLTAKYPDKRLIFISNISSFGVAIPRDAQDKAIEDFGIDNSVVIHQDVYKKFEEKENLDFPFRAKSRKDYADWNWIVIGDDKFQTEFDKFVEKHNPRSVTKYSKLC